MRRRALPFITSAALFVQVPAASGSPADVLGFGVESQALGGTGTASNESAEAAYHNPALLARVLDNELSLGVLSATFDLHATSAVKPEVQGVSGVTAGLVAPLWRSETFPKSVVLGIAAFSPRDVIARVRLRTAETPQFPLLSDRVQALNLSAGLGVDLGGGVALGAGLSILASVVGEVAAGIDPNAAGHVDDKVILASAPVFGVAYAHALVGRFGVALRLALASEVDLRLNIEDAGALDLPPIQLGGLAQYDPLALTVEYARALGPYDLSFGVTFKRWSAFPGFLRPALDCPAEHAACREAHAEKVVLSDTLVPRLGVRRTILNAGGLLGELAVGYFFDKSPLEAQQSAANRWDNDRHGFSLGYFVSLEKPLPELSLKLVGQWQHLVPRRHQKGAGVDRNNLGFPAVETQGEVFLTALSAELAF